MAEEVTQNDTGPDLPYPWERQPEESDRAFAAFALYRDLGPRRSLDEVCRRLYGTQAGRKRDATGRVQEWSRAHGWVARCQAWDEELDRQGRLAQIEAVMEMAKRHAEEARAFQEKALEGLRQIPVDQLSATDIVKFFVEAVKVERLALGEPDSVQEQRKGEGDEGDLTTSLILADPEAARLACELFERVAASAPDPGGYGLVREWEEMAAGPAPEPPQPEAP
jgi:hypothetical protein